MSIGDWQIAIIIFVNVVPSALGLLLYGRGQASLTRLPYFLQSLLCITVVFVSNNIPGGSNLFQLLLFGLMLLGMFFLGRATRLRLKDLNYSAWWGTLLFLPLVNLLFVIFCSVKAGPHSSEASKANIDTRPSFFTGIAWFMGIAAYVGYFLLGIFQIAAIMAGVQYWLGWHWLFSALVGFLLAYIPIVGTVAGVTGAIYGWGWPVFQAVLLYTVPLVLIFIFGVISDRSR